LIVGFLLRAATEGGKDTSFLRFLYNTRFVRMHGYGATDFFAATILFTVILVCTVGALAQLWAGRGSLQAALVILGLGFLSRVVVGFSPTLYASGGRTTTFFSLAILTVTLMIVSDLFDKFSGRRSRGVGFALIGVLIALNGVVGAGWLG
jgi:hypothetical protein